MNTVAVVGAGTMGNGIAHVFAQAGFEVYLIDISDAALQKAEATIQRNLDRLIKKETITDAQKAATLSRLHLERDLTRGVADAMLVVEAATEQLELKLDLFQKIDRYAPSNCILASNTSSLSITQIGSATRRPDQVIGMHFMNPVPVMQLVEVIRGYNTSDEVCKQVMQLARQLGKTPIEVEDYPGFIANRILMPMINEAIYSLFEGVAGVQEIDAIMQLGMAHPMGPLRLADFIGLDVCLSILEVLYQGFGQAKYAPCPLLVRMVNAGKLGQKSGEGFYIYSGAKQDVSVAPTFAK